MSNWLVLGVGNMDRGDDGVGRLVVRALPAETQAPCSVQETNGDAAAMLAAFSGYNAVVIVDAVQTGAEPGEIFVWDVSQRALPVGIQCASTHALGVASAIELARALGTLPAKTYVIGIESTQFTPGCRVSPQVFAAVESAVDRIQAIVGFRSFSAQDPFRWQANGAKEPEQMHEMSLITDLLRKMNQVCKENNADRVRGITVQLGPLAHISADHLREHFCEAVHGTPAEGAVLNVVELIDETHPLAQDIVLLSVDVDE